MFKPTLSRLLRRLRLLHAVDRIRYYLQRRRQAAANRAFTRAHPDVALPPDYLMYESFQLDYGKYYRGGRATAEWLRDRLKRHVDLSGKAILDWGCGPGRVIRHLPGLIDRHATFYGTDYNATSIAWCRANLPGITFTTNPLHAALPYPADSFDVIYGISILTHLSEALHPAWVAELRRVLRPGGLLVLTTQGENFRHKLTAGERARFDRGELVVRGDVREGHRIFSAFQPAAYLRTLFAGLVVRDHDEPPPRPGQAPPQDIWILQHQ